MKPVARVIAGMFLELTPFELYICRSCPGKHKEYFDTRRGMKPLIEHVVAHHPELVEPARTMQAGA